MKKTKVCVYEYYFLRVTAEEQNAGMTLNQHLLSMSMSEKPTRKNKISFVSLQHLLPVSTQLVRVVDFG